MDPVDRSRRSPREATGATQLADRVVLGNPPATSVHRPQPRDRPGRSFGTDVEGLVTADVGDGHRSGTRAFALIAAVVALVVAVVPPLRARAVAVPSTLTALDVSVPRPLAVEPERRPTTVGGIVSDSYARPDGNDPTVVIVPGATPAGRDDPRLTRLARAIARSGRKVIVPELNLYDMTVGPEDLARISAVIDASSSEAPVTVIGISYGGSLVLRTIGDHPELNRRVSLVTVFGAYGDLVGVIQGAATGVVQAGDREWGWEPEPSAEDILHEELLAALPGNLAERARAALDGQEPLEELPPGARAAVQLLTHEDPDETAAVVATLPRSLRQRLRAVSPVHVADRIRVPVRILHARDDPAVPYAEGIRLEQHLPRARLMTVASFRHVELEVSSPSTLWTAVRDLVRVWWLVGDLLSAQEPWVPARVR